MEKMSNLSRSKAWEEEVDGGLRSYLLSVYNHMMVGVLLTGLTAWTVANVPALTQFFLVSPMKWLVLFAPLAIIIGIARNDSMSEATAKFCFYGLSICFGTLFASLFLIYTMHSIALTFFVTAAAFSGLSLYGYTTKRDLSAFGAFLVMGLVGLLVAMLVNIFVQSSLTSFAINSIGVLIFSGLIAWDTQLIIWQYRNGRYDGKSAIFSALSIYLDFINLFSFLLNFMGVKKD